MYDVGINKVIETLKKVIIKRKLSELSQKIKYGCATGIDGMSYNKFSENRDKIIKGIYNDIYSGEYKLKKYKELLILKNKKELPRCISIPTIKDKLFLYLILWQLEELTPARMQLALPQKIIGDLISSINGLPSVSEIYIVKYDIRNFFKSINHKILLNDVSEVIKRSKVPSILNEDFLNKACRNIIQNPTGSDNNKVYTGVPQGIPVASCLSQIYADKVQCALEHAHIIFFRYVDDVMIICNSIDKEVAKSTFECEIQKNKLIINEKKLVEGLLEQNDFNFLGYNFSLYKNHTLKVSVKETNLTKIKRKIVNIIKVLAKKRNPDFLFFKLNGFISGSIFSKGGKKAKFGWLFFYSQINDVQMLYNLDSFIKKEILKVFPTIDKTKLNSYSLSFLSEEELICFRKSALDLSTFVRKVKGPGYLHLNSFVKSYRAIKDKKNSEVFAQCFYKYTHDDKIFILNEILGDHRIKKNSKNKTIDKHLYTLLYSSINKNEKDIFNSIS